MSRRPWGLGIIDGIFGTHSEEPEYEDANNGAYPPGIAVIFPSYSHSHSRTHLQGQRRNQPVHVHHEQILEENIRYASPALKEKKKTKKPLASSQPTQTHYYHYTETQEHVSWNGHNIHINSQTTSVRTGPVVEEPPLPEKEHKTKAYLVKTEIAHEVKEKKPFFNIPSFNPSRNTEKSPVQPTSEHQPAKVKPEFIQENPRKPVIEHPITATPNNQYKKEDPVPYDIKHNQQYSPSETKPTDEAKLKRTQSSQEMLRRPSSPLEKPSPKIPFAEETPKLANEPPKIPPKPTKPVGIVEPKQKVVVLPEPAKKPVVLDVNQEADISKPVVFKKSDLKAAIAEEKRKMREEMEMMKRQEEEKKKQEQEKQPQELLAKQEDAKKQQSVDYN